MIDRRRSRSGWDTKAAHRPMSAIRSGMVSVNVIDKSSMATFFCGLKQSGGGLDRSPYATGKHTDFKTIWTSYARPCRGNVS